MGGTLSLDSSKSKEVHENCTNQRLIADLPDEISLQILARVPRIDYLNLKAVSRTWRRVITGRELYDLRKELGKSEEWLYMLTKANEDGNNRLVWFGVDPILGKWQRLPPMPVAFPEDDGSKGVDSRVADAIKSWLGGREDLGCDRVGPAYCGCSVGAVDGSLYVLGGLDRASALKNVWRYDPAYNSWAEAGTMFTGRAYCKTVALDGRLYAVGGFDRASWGASQVPIQSAEVYDPRTGRWAQLPSMPFSLAKSVPSTFLTDLLKPIAAGMVAFRGRLFVAQSIYFWPYMANAGGEVYDPEAGKWDEISAGMGEGWPETAVGAESSVTIVEGELYSLEGDKIKTYNHKDDEWKVVAEDVPINSKGPNFLAGFLRKLHVIKKDSKGNIIVIEAGIEDSVSQSSGPWKVIARKSVGSTDLESCVTLHI